MSLSIIPVPAGRDQHFEIDFGGLVNALFVDGDAILGLYNVTTRNNGPRLKRTTGGVLYREDMFGPWPSIVLAPGATVGAPLHNLFCLLRPQSLVLFEDTMKLGLFNGAAGSAT